MPLKIVAPDKLKRKAKRGQTEGGGDSSWKRPYKDYTKIKYSPFIKTGTGKKGMLQEQAGAPGGEKKLHDKAMKRLNEIQKLKSKKGTRMDSPGSKKRLKHLQSNKFKTGGRAGYQGGGRTNLFEELGRVEAEPSNRNRRAEISRVHGELNRGYKDGKRVKKGNGGSMQQHYLQHGYGPHKIQLRSGKPKLAKKGW